MTIGDPTSSKKETVLDSMQQVDDKSSGGSRLQTLNSRLCEAVKAEYHNHVLTLTALVMLTNSQNTTACKLIQIVILYVPYCIHRGSCW